MKRLIHRIVHVKSSTTRVLQPINSFLQSVEQCFILNKRNQKDLAFFVNIFRTKVFFWNIWERERCWTELNYKLSFKCYVDSLTYTKLIFEIITDLDGTFQIELKISRFHWPSSPLGLQFNTNVLPRLLWRPEIRWNTKIRIGARSSESGVLLENLWLLCWWWQIWPTQNDAKTLKKWVKPWHMGTYLTVLCKSYPMNTNMAGFRWFKKILTSRCFGRM